MSLAHSGALIGWRQRTLKAAIDCVGIGVHSGLPVTLRQGRVPEPPLRAGPVWPPAPFGFGLYGGTGSPGFLALAGSGGDHSSDRHGTHAVFAYFRENVGARNRRSRA